MYRSATHPDFIKYEIEPALVLAELPTSLALIVGQHMDAFGYDTETTVRIFASGLESFKEFG